MPNRDPAPAAPACPAGTRPGSARRAAVKRLAVLGSPIGAALSPVLHRAAYAELGLPWTYAAVDCDAERLPAFLAGLDDTWAGLSLTMPLKRVAAPLLDEVSAVAADLGCVNTVIVRDGRLIGANTDVHGMVSALREAGADRPDSVSVLGCGATACTALAAARELGATRVTAVVRDELRTGPLRAAADALGVELRVLPWTRLSAALAADAVVATLPPRALDLSAPVWPSGPGVFLDVAYQSGPGAAAAGAQAAGRRIASGLTMLVHQAALQVELQTGVPTAPLEAIRRAAEAHSQQVAPPRGAA